MTETAAQDRSQHAERARTLIRALGMLPVLILLAIGFELLTDRFMTVNNLSIVTQQASINVVLAAESLCSGR